MGLRDRWLNNWPRAAGVLLAAGMLALAVNAVRSEARSWREIADAVVTTLPTTVPLLTLGVGFVLLGAGWPRREGDGPSCGRCGYTVLEPRERLVPLCPECSNPWRYFGRATRGRLRWGTGYLAAGIAAMVLAAGGAWMQSRLRAGIVAGLPTTTLLRHLSSLGERSGQAWRALGSRTLTPREREALEGVVLDRRVRLGRLDAGMEPWLDHEVFMGRLGAIGTERYYREMTVVSMRVSSERLAAGEGAWAAVEVTGRRSDLRTPMGVVWVIVDGYEWVALEPLPDRPPVAFRVGAGVRPGRTQEPWPAEGAAATTRLAFTPLGPGRAVVRARGWIVVSPLRHALGWGDGAEPVFDSAPVHVRAFEVEQEVGVE